MRVVRGRAADVAEDRAITEHLVADAGETGEPAIRVWTPHRQVAFGRRDAREPGYDRAREAAADRGYAPYERETGGRAVAYTGHTVAFTRIEPVAELRTGIEERYDEAVSVVRAALADCGVDAERGEPPESFCPGAHSLSADGKLVGIAQRVGSDVARVGGIVVVRDHAAIAAVLAPVYDALGVPFDPGSVGSVARARGVDPERVDPTTVARTLEEHLVGTAATTVERVD
ncbi:lipoate--protein ligase family protein [Haloglomus litoreum]|uniref:lipoate--protein ligase family protein n=1 Tax=Haloglomus litoreum TaxID=3034026 RepID=UPI0023E85EDB|nr:lipoate--protein ligase family protein [Haloglomus sp. DT116]